MEKEPGKKIDASCLLDEQLLQQLAFNEKMAELGKLTAGVVHDLNSPVSVIVSAAQMILREEHLPEFVKEMVERIGLEAQRLSQFSKGLLSFARTDGDGDRDVDVNLVLQEIMDFLRLEAQKRHIRVIEENDYDLPAVAIGSNQLKQVLINLIMNAFNTMSQGGTIFLKTSLADQLVSVEVADTGDGMTAEAAAHFFEPFFITDAPQQGTNLGLYLSKYVVEHSGGQLRVKTAPHQGTSVTLLLPCLS